jgi:hypothetical protein
MLVNPAVDDTFCTPFFERGTPMRLRILCAVIATALCAANASAVGALKPDGETEVHRQELSGGPLPQRMDQTADRRSHS